MMLKNIRGLEFYGSMEDWKPKQSDKIMIRDFIRFLEVHPPLYKPFKVEAPPGIEEIVVEIRRKITELLADPEIDDRTAGILKTMRGALRKYLDTTQNIKGRKYIRDIIFPLIELRSVIGLCVGILAVMYVIDVDKNLASLIPISNDDGTDMGFAGAIPKI
jgi:hypothetical protein